MRLEGINLLQDSRSLSESPAVIKALSAVLKLAKRRRSDEGGEIGCDLGKIQGKSSGTAWKCLIAIKDSRQSVR